jgi:hypothetical protein
MQDLTKFKTFLSEIQDSFLSIPFGNSDFQIANFIVNAAQTPERAFRAVCLSLRDKILTLNETYYNQLKFKVDLDELQEKISDPATEKYARRRMEIDYEQKISQQRDNEKLLIDAIHEVELLYSFWQKLPHPTRAEFEAAEEDYFKISLTKQVLGIDGAVGSLENMGYVLNSQGRLQNTAPKLIDTLKISNISAISER